MLKMTQAEYDELLMLRAAVRQAVVDSYDADSKTRTFILEHFDGRGLGDDRQLMLGAELTNAEFANVAKQTCISEHVLQAARLVLVYGYTHAQARRMVQSALSPQQVHFACECIRGMMRRRKGSLF